MLSGTGYGVSVDWWAAGVLLAELSMGCHPFAEPSISHGLDRSKPCHQLFVGSSAIMSGTLINKLPMSTPRELGSLISALMHCEPNRRLSTLNHSEKMLKDHDCFVSAGVNFKNLRQWIWPMQQSHQVCC